MEEPGGQRVDQIVGARPKIRPGADAGERRYEMPKEVIVYSQKG